MENNLLKKLMAKKWLLIIAAIIVIALIIVAVIAFNKDDSKPETTDKNKVTQTSDNDNKTDETSKPAVETSPESITADNGTASIEDAPEPTLSPETANDVILETDPEPMVTLKQNQKTFNDCMEAQDYAGAKNVLDTYFATEQFAKSGTNTYDNYVYYYEKQGLYQESAMYQIDYLEREMGLDNIIEANTRYQKLLETLKYVTIQDPRLDAMAASVNRWKEIQELLDNQKIDTAIEKLQGYIQNGMQECVYAYHYLAKAYGAKPDYFKQARTYYIFLTRLSVREPNTLEISFQPVFLEHAHALYDMFLITDEERSLIQDTIDANSLP